MPQFKIWLLRTDNGLGHRQGLGYLNATLFTAGSIDMLNEGFLLFRAPLCGAPPPPPLLFLSLHYVNEAHVDLRA
jgi:hypothetical protein